MASEPALAPDIGNVTFINERSHRWHQERTTVITKKRSCLDCVFVSITPSGQTVCMEFGEFLMSTDASDCEAYSHGQE